MESNITSTSTKGVVIGLVLVVYSLALYFLDLRSNGVVQSLSYVLFLAGIIWSISTYAKQINYTGTFGSYFSHGFKVAAVVTLIMVVFVVVFLLMFPDLKEQTIEESRKQMQKKGNITQEQMDTALNITRKFWMPFAIGGTLLMYLIAGAISALIGAAVIKKKPDSTLEHLNQNV